MKSVDLFVIIHELGGKVLLWGEKMQKKTKKHPKKKQKNKPNLL